MENYTRAPVGSIEKLVVRGVCVLHLYISCVHCTVFIVQQSGSMLGVKHLHSWAQGKLSPLNLLNILLFINGPLIS